MTVVFEESIHPVETPRRSVSVRMKRRCSFLSTTKHTKNTKIGEIPWTLYEFLDVFRVFRVFRGGC
ncbi:hypothetical protein U14_01741 [Candidatus Moduliflexus flocculans]|uniref:Uncharacterized protein n=1 Tax=Candidatus Moduliflexus flocculans TaxID=1499966 RepID=A0A0S6VZC0_9BACT|nr:hypothetical protein U14_01741 [Candidatus Moduliflexus flocculans]